MQTFTAVVKNEGNCWIGWIEEVPGVNCLEATRAELLETLRVTLVEAIGLGFEELSVDLGGMVFECRTDKEAALERILSLNLHLEGVAPSRDELHKR